jgi:tetratricopeptide (TPR) repeat protein
LGEFFIAARNAEKALSFDPTDANTYGQLGMIYVKSRNYEGALPVLKCVVNGCTAEENEVGAEIVQSLPLSSLTVAYYYLQYASVLAALNMCEQAIPVLDQVNQIYPSDPIIKGIIDENSAICQGFNLIPTPVGNP